MGVVSEENFCSATDLSKKNVKRENKVETILRN